jgi:hypothetical protein
MKKLQTQSLTAQSLLLKVSGFLVIAAMVFTLTGCA